MRVQLEKHWPSLACFKSFSSLKRTWQHSSQIMTSGTSSFGLIRAKWRYLEMTRNWTKHLSSNTTPTVQHGEGSLLIWACLASTRPSSHWPEHILPVYQRILESNVRQLFQQLKLRSTVPAGPAWLKLFGVYNQMPTVWKKKERKFANKL